MRFRHLRIRINTDKGPHGVDIDFPDGLVVLRADNSMGKSTCIQCIVVALGLEAMLTTNQRDLPLPHVMKEELFSNDDLVQVIESDIFLEIENSNGERVVVHRTVKGSRMKNLVTVTFGPALTDSTGYYNSEDFFVSRPGSATRERGFHRFLAEFFDWDLPNVQTFEGRETPLYLQCVFPFIIVEQKRGWASLIPPIPTQFRIREPHKRSIEFLLRLDAYIIAAKRIELNNRMKEVESEWSSTVRELRTMAETIGGIISKLPEKPIAKWPPEILPIIQLPYADTWVPLEDLIQTNKLELQYLIEQEIPQVNEITASAGAELAVTQENLREKEVILSNLLNSLEMERGQVKSVEIRLEKLEEDIQRNKDAKILLSLGSTIAPNIAKNVCPTCHQHIEDSLTPLAEEQNVMSIDDNLVFLEEQRRTFRAALRNTKAIVEARMSQVAQLREEFAGDRARIRTLRETLVSDSRLPSMEAIRKRVELEENISRRSALLEQFQNKLGRLEPLSEQWFEIQKERENLPREDTSSSDRVKIREWNSYFVDQLVKYDFQSLAADTITISSDTYIPTHEGFDLPSNISASDFIRIIWSYLNGLLEVSRDFETNHPGTLIFDEPKQQSAKNLSFAALLDRVSQSKNYGQQVIFATSENEDNLRNILENVPHTFLGFKGRIIQPL